MRLSTRGRSLDTRAPKQDAGRPQAVPPGRRHNLLTLARIRGRGKAPGRGASLLSGAKVRLTKGALKLLRRVGPIALIAVTALVMSSCDKSNPTKPPKKTPTFDVVDWPYDITPDASRAIYRHRRSRDRVGGVYILETGGGASHTLLFADSLQFFANDCRFSPDGSKVVYTRNFLSDIFIRNLEDSTDTQVTFTNGNARAADWDPSGRSIVYMRVFLDYGMPDSTAGLHVVDLKTFADVSLRASGNPVFGSNPRWSPDGSLIAYSLQTRITPSGSPTPPHIYVARVDGTGTSDLTPGDKRNNEYPEWLSNGPEIVFESYGERSYNEHVTRAMRADGAARRTLPVDVRPYIAYGAVAASVAKFVYTGPDSAGEYGVILLRNLDDGQGATIRQLTTYEPPDSGFTAIRAMEHEWSDPWPRLPVPSRVVRGLNGPVRP
jgi:dipeptidyl aminopeptidase/acylaminoacyl peptidase